MFPLSLQGCTCSTIPEQYRNGEQLVYPCYACIMFHVMESSKCPGPCHRHLTGIVMADSTIHPVERKEPRIEPLPGEVEHLLDLAAFFAAEDDAAAEVE